MYYRNLIRMLGIPCVLIGPSQGTISVHEIKIGLAKNDVRGLKMYSNHERGPNLNLEVLSDSLKGGFWDSIFQPQAHLGFHFNTRKGTHQLYTGLTWTITFGKFLLEPTLGGGVHSGRLHKQSRTKQALGSKILFRESIALGYKITSHAKVYFFVDHMSNARIAHPNPGMTTVGFKIGYVF